LSNLVKKSQLITSKYKNLVVVMKNKSWCHSYANTI